MGQVMTRRLTLTGSTLRPRSNEFKTLVAQEIAAHVWPLVEAGLLDKRRAAVARRHVFKIRNRVVDLMAEFRAEWRKRYGDR